LSWEEEGNRAREAGKDRNHGVTSQGPLVGVDVMYLPRIGRMWQSSHPKRKKKKKEATVSLPKAIDSVYDIGDHTHN
jgi:hypothetical protein